MMNRPKILFCLMLFALVFGVRAEDVKCAVCGQPIQDHFFTVFDRVEGTKKKICESCDQIKEHCFICDMPVKDGFKTLVDGRYICARDVKNVIESEAEAKEICHGVRDGLDRLLSRFMDFPDDNVQLSIVDKFRLENLFHARGYESACVSYFGATTSNPLPNGKYRHTIDILSYIDKPRLMAVCAHEYTHTWVAENVKLARRRVLDKNTHEAFCELVAYKYMESLNEDGQMESIRRNHYTVGQIEVLLAADAKYGFNTVVDWIKDGEDNTITMENLDRIRYVKDEVPKPRPDAIPAYAYVAPVAPKVVPNTLMLKGISGTGQRRFALINDATLETMERARVRVGQTNVIVRCLEIRTNSVIIEIAGAREKKELFISTK
jgi:hypothetical protein